ncbi:MAG: hypothetical protein IJ357_08730 [Oscillospiraceae bacterium]|nr:hypothetical protein [Oscillospiraceae bacterium]
MSNQSKAGLVCAVIILLVALLVYLIVSMVRTRKHLVVKGIISALLIFPLVFLAPYTDYREKELELQLVDVLIDKTATGNEPLDSLEWYAIYDSYGIGVESRFNQYTIPYVDWCELDLENHTYIISFGREIKSVTYNIWDSRLPALFDLGSSYKVGHVEFAEEIDTTKVYVYETKRVRVDHDINNMAGTFPW